MPFLGKSLKEWMKRSLPVAILGLTSYLLTLISDQFYEHIGATIGYKPLLIMCTILLLLALYLVLFTKNLKSVPSNEKIEAKEPRSQYEIDCEFDRRQSSKPTPREILDQISEQPQILRSEFCKHFKGIKVTWFGTYDAAYDIGDNNVRIGVGCDNICFYFTTSLIEHPIFRTLNKEAKRLKVNGTIVTVEEGINLIGVNFSFLS